MSLDLNGLKKINDTAGHHAGDLALVTVSKCISDCISNHSQAYRIGGDEFVVLFFSENAAVVPDIEKKINDAVKKNRLQHCSQTRYGR